MDLTSGSRCDLQSRNYKVSLYYSQFSVAAVKIIHFIMQPVVTKCKLCIVFSFLCPLHCCEQPTCCEPVIMLRLTSTINSSCVHKFLSEHHHVINLCMLSVCSLNCIIMHVQTLFSRMFVQLHTQLYMCV